MSTRCLSARVRHRVQKMVLKSHVCDLKQAADAIAILFYNHSKSLRAAVTLACQLLDQISQIMTIPSSLPMLLSLLILVAPQLVRAVVCPSGFVRPPASSNFIC
jgi:hypothetical protein